MDRVKGRGAACLLLLAASAGTDADVRNRFGAVISSDASFESAATATYQVADDARLDDEFLMSLDLVAHRNLGEGQITLYAEAATTVNVNGIASNLIEANGDAASALDAEGRGRFQVSELHYTCVQTSDCFTVGLLDPSAFLDRSSLANDESTQFLNQTFVNNPTIAFPDYTLGFVIHRDFTAERPGFTWMLTASDGLADNPERSYSELLDLTAPGKGLFTGLELYTPALGGRLRIGGWLSTADHDSLADNRTDLHNYGAYLVIDSSFKELPWSLRLGAANPEVSPTVAFASIALEHELEDTTLGLALGYSKLSDKLDDPELDDRTTAEFYARFHTPRGTSLTPSIQYIRNSGYDSSETAFDSPLLVYSLRGSFYF